MDDDKIEAALYALKQACDDEGISYVILLENFDRGVRYSTGLTFSASYEMRDFANTAEAAADVMENREEGENPWEGGHG